jgi:uncharacterized protein (TIGR03085 family)
VKALEFAAGVPTARLEHDLGHAGLGQLPDAAPDLLPRRTLRDTAYARSMSHHAVDERHEFAHTLREAGPDAPTLCPGWTTAELTAHLVLRERSLVEPAGRLPIARLRARGEAALANYLARTGYHAAVARFDAGPPRWSPFALPVLGEGMDLIEYVVHHEDVRRAGEGWQPRALPVARQQAIWSWLRRAARFTLRRAPVGVELVWPSHGSATAHRARNDGPVVTVTGDPVELALVAFGRQRVGRVVYDGDPADVTALTEAHIAV